MHPRLQGGYNGVEKNQVNLKFFVQFYPRNYHALEIQNLSMVEASVSKLHQLKVKLYAREAIFSKLIIKIKVRPAKTRNDWS